MPDDHETLGMHVACCHRKMSPGRAEKVSQSIFLMAHVVIEPVTAMADFPNVLTENVVIPNDDENEV